MVLLNEILQLPLQFVYLKSAVNSSNSSNSSSLGSSLANFSIFISKNILDLTCPIRTSFYILFGPLINLKRFLIAISRDGMVLLNQI